MSFIKIIAAWGLSFFVVPVLGLAITSLLTAPLSLLCFKGGYPRLAGLMRGTATGVAAFFGIQLAFHLFRVSFGPLIILVVAGSYFANDLSEARRYEGDSAALMMWIGEAIGQLATLLLCAGFYRQLLIW